METFFQEKISVDDMDIKTLIKEGARVLGNLCLTEIEFANYDGEDMLNATFIFSYFLNDLMWSANEGKTKEERLKLVEEMGDKLHELILSATGYSMKDVAKKITEK